MILNSNEAGLFEDLKDPEKVEVQMDSRKFGKTYGTGKKCKLMKSTASASSK